MKKDAKAESESVERALQIDPGSIDAWAYLTGMTKESDGEEKAIAKIEELANAPVNARTATPYIALQGFFANDEKTRDKAIGFAKKAVERAPQDPLALLCLSALYGQNGKLDEVIKLLAPHEAMMQKDVRLAHNYFEALFQSKDMARITSLLNKLATSPSREVKQFAIERAFARHLAAPRATAGRACGEVEEQRTWSGRDKTRCGGLIVGPARILPASSPVTPDIALVAVDETVRVEPRTQ